MPSLMFAIHFQTFSLSSSGVVSEAHEVFKLQISDNQFGIRTVMVEASYVAMAQILHVYMCMYSPGEHIIDVLGEESSHHRVHHRAFPSGEAPVTCSITSSIISS